MITCNCPPPASLPDLECVRCYERFGQIQKVAFQRIMNDDGTKNKFSAVSGFSEINSLANWQALMTAADSTKIVISPYIYSPTQENGAARTFGGGNDSLNGVEEIIGREPSTFSASLRNVPQSIAKVLKSLQCENVGVYLIDGNGNVEALGIVDENNNEWIMPIPIKSFFVGDKTHGGIDAPDANVIQWSFVPNYSDDIKIFTIDTFNVLSDLCSGNEPPAPQPAYITNMQEVNWTLDQSATTSVKFVRNYDVSNYQFVKTIADGLIEVYRKDGEYIFMYEGDIYAPVDSTYLFGGLANLAHIDFSNFNTSRVTSMNSMFYGGHSLTTLDLSNFDTSNVTDMTSMFHACTSLITLDLSNFDTSNVTKMQSMFHGCEVMTSLIISNFNTSNVTTMRYMFFVCYALVTIYGGDWSKASLNDSADMFSSCNSLIGGNGTSYNSSHTDATYARIDRAGTPGYFTQA